MLLGGMVNESDGYVVTRLFLPLAEQGCYAKKSQSLVKRRQEVPHGYGKGSLVWKCSTRAFYKHQRMKTFLKMWSNAPYVHFDIDIVWR